MTDYVDALIDNYYADRDLNDLPIENLSDEDLDALFANRAENGIAA